MNNPTANAPEIKEMLAENTRRLKVLDETYDPLSGRGGSGQRVKVMLPVASSSPLYLPEAMVESREYKSIGSYHDYMRLRLKHDFDFWCFNCVVIRHKQTGCDVALVLNRPQRRVATLLERDRLASRPLRLIMLKARQWGGSTLVQMYFAWIQTVHRNNWHSFICAHVKDTSAIIRGMYDKMLQSYPEEYWDGDEPPALRPYGNTRNTREIAGRRCRITLASSNNQEAARGADCAMAHLSEVAFWKDSPRSSPEDFIRAVCSGIPLVPYSFIALESTANGVGNFFHREWLKAERGESDKIAVFVPWHEIEMYAEEVADHAAFAASLDDYEKRLWELGATLEQICWYRHKLHESTSREAMMAEFPTTAVEAFVNTGSGVFANSDVDLMRRDCRPPTMRGTVSGDAPVGAGALSGVRFRGCDTPDAFSVWEMPAAVKARNRYVVCVDIGGRSRSSDYSVIAVFDRGERPGDRPRIVAQWRGHTDHDLVGWKAAAVARWYHEALLVIESNTLESEAYDGASFILSELPRHYTNMYMREGRSPAGSRVTKAGFHTNRSTKQAAVTTLIAAVRDGGYTERDNEACNEMVTYEVRPNGAYGSKSGYHDDILMTRAIGLYVIASLPPMRISENPFPAMPKW